MPEFKLWAVVSELQQKVKELEARATNGVPEAIRDEFKRIDGEIRMIKARMGRKDGRQTADE